MWRSPEHQPPLSPGFSPQTFADGEAASGPDAPQLPSPLTLGDDRLPDDIRIDYHPKAKLPPVVFRFEDFKRTHCRAEIDPEVYRQEPWAPFKSRAVSSRAVSPLLCRCVVCWRPRDQATKRKRCNSRLRGSFTLL